MKLIGICGDIGSGKDTVADHLVAEHGFTTLSFAAPLKEWTLSLVEPLGVERRHIFGGSVETKQADQAKPLDFLPRRLGFTDDDGCCHEGAPWTGRGLLEYLGTEVARGIHPDVWVLHLRHLIQTKLGQHFPGDSELRFVIPDLRFPNEFVAVQSMTGEVWRTRLLTLHGMDLKGHPDELTTCPAGDDWRASCKCGAIRSTGHESDEAWRLLDFDRLLAAKKPGVEKLRELADAALGEMS